VSSKIEVISGLNLHHHNREKREEGVQRGKLPEYQSKTKETSTFELSFFDP